MEARIKFSAICGEVEVAHMHNISDSSSIPTLKLGVALNLFLLASAVNSIGR